jgi:fermentation-respiration switch protein FrsA (DUF1100 family)
LREEVTWMLRFVVSGLGAYGAAVGALYFVQRRLMYFPDRSVPDPLVWGARDMEAVRLTTADGLELLAWYRPALSPAGPVLAYFHGNGGHIGMRVRKVRPYLDVGCGVLLVSYRGYGGNAGRPSERGLYEDGRAALEFLSARGVAPSRTVLYGESLGAGVAVRMARDVRVGAVVLEAAFPSAADVAAHHFPLVPVRWLIRDRFECESRIARIGAPLFLLHGERDEIVPVDLGRRLFAAASEPKEARFVPQAGHNNLYDFAAPEAVLDFIARHLPAS